MGGQVRQWDAACLGLAGDLGQHPSQQTQMAATSIESANRDGTRVIQPP